jgi:hypothetical protein
MYVFQVHVFIVFKVRKIIVPENTFIIKGRPRQLVISTPDNTFSELGTVTGTKPGWNSICFLGMVVFP